jgi:putative ABC transport system permease protein
MILLNRRNTVIIILGLGISLAIISEGLIFMYSYQYNAFIEFEKEIPPKQLTINVDAIDVTNYQDNYFPFFNQVTSEAIENAELNESILRFDWFGLRGAMLYVDSKSNPGQGQLVMDSNVYSLPPDYFSVFEELLYNGTMPIKENDVIAVMSRQLVENSNLSRLGMFPVYVPVFEYNKDIYYAVELGIPAAGFYVNVTGVILTEDFENYKGSIETDMSALDDYFSDNFLVTRYTNIMSYVSSLEDPRANPGYQPFFCRFSFDFSLINAYNIEGEIAKLNRMGQELSREFAKYGLDVLVYIDLIEELRDFRQEFTIFQLIGFFFIAPIIGMALTLTNYSTNLLKKRQKRQVSSMFQRGSSRKDVLVLLVTQVVEITIMSILVCIIIGYPFASLMLKSDGFLNFSGVSIFPAINMIIFYLIIGAAMIFSIIINARNIWDMANISTVEAYGTVKQKTPTWQKTYIDIFLLIIGIAFWLVVRLHLKGPSAYSFAIGFGTTAPILLILGSILFASRLYPYFISILSNIGWKRTKLGILGLSAKRGLRRKNTIIRSLVLISITFTLLISSITTINSYTKFDREQAYYKLGADILIRNVKVKTDETKNRVLDIEGVEAGTYMKYTSQITTFGAVVYSYVAVGIDPDEYVKVATLEDYYLKNPKDKQEFFSHLKNNLSVAMQIDQMEKIGLEKNDDFRLTIEKYPQSAINVSVNIASVYNLIPRFFVEYPDPDNPVHRFTIVGNYNLTETIAYSKFSIGGDMIVKVAPGYEINEVAEEIEYELGRKVYNVNSLMSASKGNLRNTILYGSLNTLFISSMVVIIAAISLLIFIQSIENDMEVNLLKTMGMSPRQLFSLFTIEAVALISFGSIVGLVVGLFSSRMFIRILTIDIIVPPERLILQPGQMIMVFGMLFIAAISAAALTSWIIFRKDTIKGIKQI